MDNELLGMCELSHVVISSRLCQWVPFCFAKMHFKSQIFYLDKEILARHTNRKTKPVLVHLLTILWLRLLSHSFILDLAFS